MKIKSQKDFFAGLLYLLIGGSFAIGSTNYQIGTSARMGPGYFPMMVGSLLAFIGVVIMFKALVVETPDGDKVGKWAWKQVFFIILSNLVFGVLLIGLPSIGLPGMGLIVAIYGLTIIASLAGEHFVLKEVLILATSLAVGSYFVFIWALKLVLPVWPSFIVG